MCLFVLWSYQLVHSVPKLALANQTFNKPPALVEMEIRLMHVLTVPAALFLQQQVYTVVALFVRYVQTNIVLHSTAIKTRTQRLIRWLPYTWTSFCIYNEQIQLRSTCSLTDTSGHRYMLFNSPQISAARRSNVMCFVTAAQIYYRTLICAQGVL